MDSKTNKADNEIINIKKDLSELKQERESLRDYYQVLKERRERIIALKKIKDNHKRQAAIKKENEVLESVPLVFQNGEFKGKTSNLLVKSKLMEEDDQKRLNLKIDRTPIQQRERFSDNKDFIKQPLKTNDISAHEYRDTFEQSKPRRENLTRTVPDMVEPKLDLSPSRSVPPPLPPQPPVFVTNNNQTNAPIIQKQAVPTNTKMQQEHLQQDVNSTNLIQPESALILDPFEKQKSKQEIRENIHQLMPKYSPLFVTMIVILTVILVLLLILLLIWGFASDWQFSDPKDIWLDIKNFFQF